MNLVGILLDLGNVAFFVSNLPQLLTAYRNRRDLRGLSGKMLLGFTVSTLLFISAGWLARAPLTVILGCANVVFFTLQLHWKRKYPTGSEVTSSD